MTEQQSLFGDMATDDGARTDGASATAESPQDVRAQAAARAAEVGEGLRRTEGGRWGSGKLLAALEGWVERLPGRGREKEGRRQKLGRLLLKLFEWIRRELHADHHRD